MFFGKGVPKRSSWYDCREPHSLISFLTLLVLTTAFWRRRQPPATTVQNLSSFRIQCVGRQYLNSWHFTNLLARRNDQVRIQCVARQYLNSWHFTNLLARRNWNHRFHVLLSPHPTQKHASNQMYRKAQVGHSLGKTKQCSTIPSSWGHRRPI
jgi:hypothetical protein